MKRVLTLFIIMAAMIAVAANPPRQHRPAPQQRNQLVYVCTGKYAKRYHSNPKCKGLESCKGEIVRMTVQQAEAHGKSPCRRCY